jgi:prepilin-type N-terminal cleavage/methylation domain-containing protein
MIRRGLSLIEAIIVIVIIGLLAILAVPRFSHADSEPSDMDPRPALVTLRSAIELYYYDHGAYPGQQSDGVSPPGSAEAFCRQLTAFTDAEGRTSAEKTQVFRFGPYLRDGIPACPVPPRQGMSGIVTTTDAPAFQESAADGGWVYNCQTGAVSLNSDALDAAGLSYDRY